MNCLFLHCNSYTQSLFDSVKKRFIVGQKVLSLPACWNCQEESFAQQMVRIPRQEARDGVPEYLKLHGIITLFLGRIKIRVFFG